MMRLYRTVDRMRRVGYPTPVLLTAVVPAAGTTIVLTFSTPMQGTGTVTLTGVAAGSTTTLASGAGTTVLTFTPAGTITHLDTPKVNHSSGNLASMAGVLWPSVTLFNVTNNSIQ